MCIHDPSAGVVNLIDHNRLAVRAHASIVADTCRETRLAYFREITGGFFRVGNRGCEWLARAQSKTFRAEKPKRLVPSFKVRNIQRPAGICPELVLHPGRPRSANSVQKEIVRIKDLVAEIFVRFPVNGTCPRLRAEIGDATGKLSPLRSQIAGLNLELLNRILRRNQDGQVNVTDVQRLAIEVLCALVPKRTVHLVVAPPKRIHSHRRTRGAALRDHGCRQLNEVKNIAAVEGQLIDFPLLHNRTHCCRFGIQQWSPSLNRDAFGSRAQHHLEINFQGVLHVENKIGLDHRFKSQLLHFDAIASGRQVRKVIASYLIRDGFVVDSRAGVDHDDFRTWDNRLA